MQTKGAYFGLPNVDPWDISRDARLYAGSNSVVAHPPCSRWCQLAYINEKRYGHKVGDDQGCFDAALRAVRTWGGVLEHPAFSYAWPAFGLPRPARGKWVLVDGMWVTEVSQSAYGHKARKRTWLLYCSPARQSPLDLNWAEPAPSAQISFCKNHGNSPLPRLSKKEAAATPIAFRDMLISLAECAK